MNTIVRGTPIELGRVKGYQRIPDPDSSLVKYHLNVSEELVVVDLRRLWIEGCSCEQWGCEHGKAAQQLETIYQEKHKETPCSCSICGHMGKRYSGLDLCPNCAD